MRTKQRFQNLKNSQRIRVILNSVGFYTTVNEVDNLVFVDQREAVIQALSVLSLRNQGSTPITGYGTNCGGVNVQVDLIF